jgi:hypothetical protein
MSLVLESLACDLYGSKRRLIAWHVVLGMTVKVFICEIICKRNNAWRVGRAAIVKALHGGEVRGLILTDSIKIFLALYYSNLTNILLN